MKLKIRMKAILGWLWVFALSLFYSMPLVLFATWKTFQRFSWTQEHPIAYLQILWGLAILVLIFLSWLINKWVRAKKWDQRGALRIALLTIITVFLVIFNMDDGKIDKDYTWDDVPNPPHAEESYALLLKAFGPEAKSISQLKLPDDMEAVFKDPLAHKAEIEKWWQETEETRKLMAKLDEYEVIGDLIGENLLAIRFTDIRKLFRVIYVHAALKSIEGHVDEGLPDLMRCHSIIRKVLPCSRFLINKLILLANASNNIKAVYEMDRQLAMDKETLQIVKNRFLPLTEQEINIKRMFITEYLFTKKMGEKAITENSYLTGVFMPWCIAETNSPSLNTWEKMISRLFFHITFKPNQTLSEIRTYYDLCVLVWHKHPWALEELKTYETSRRGKLKLNNLGYWILSSDYHMSDYTKKISVIKVRSDLLTFYLAHRLGVKTELKDFYTGIDYQLDEKYGARSAGPDGQFNTEDDITLDVASGK